jgi:ribosome-binding protein aMBF1 (putative translation factor)
VREKDGCRPSPQAVDSLRQREGIAAVNVSEVASMSDAGTGFGSRLRHARRAKGLTRNQLARLLGVHERTVARWELQQQVPHEQHLFRLAGELGVRPVWLFDGIPPMYGSRPR